MEGVRVFIDFDDLIQAAAEFIVHLSARAIQSRGGFSIALAGGSTPAPLYERLATPPFLEQLDWSSIYIYWGDERVVPPDHAESNYRMAKEALLEHAPIPVGHIFRMQGELPPQSAADAYHTLLESSPNLSSGGKIPRFDLILLGLGQDGHTASLFPSSMALKEVGRWAVPNYVEKLDRWRITLTPPVINNAGDVCFLVSGEEKAQTLARILHGPYRPDLLPAQTIQPTNGNLHWLIDQSSASEL